MVQGQEGHEGPDIDAFRAETRRVYKMEGCRPRRPWAMGTWPLQEGPLRETSEFTT